MTSIEKLKAERAQIEVRQARRREAEKGDQARLAEIEERLHREKLISLIGVPDAVVVKFQMHKSDKLAFLNSARGTVVAVNRTRAKVIWDTPAPTDGYCGEWNWTIGNLLPAEEACRQGYVIPWR